jgi:general secretion pathway protein C
MVSRLKKISPSVFSWLSVHRFAPWALFIGVTWLCWQLASIFWLLLTPPTAPQARSVMLGTAVTNNVPDIVGFKLFAEKSEEVNSEPDVPMQLEGVFVARPVSLSAALINVSSASKRYRVGQTIDGTSYKLESVSWNKISLQKDDGTIQTLKFGDSAMTTGDGASSGPLIKPQDTGQSSKAALNTAIQEFKKNPSGYLNQIGLASAGNDRGYDVTDNFSADLRNKTGLRVGDKIIEVNGKPVGNPESDVQLLKQVQQSYSDQAQIQAQIQIQRGDQTLTIQQSF